MKRFLLIALASMVCVLAGCRTYNTSVTVCFETPISHRMIGTHKDANLKLELKLLETRLNSAGSILSP